MADDRIEVEIVLDDGSIQKGFAKIRQEGNKTEKKLESNFSKAFRRTQSGVQGLTKSVFNLRNAFVGIGAALGGGALIRQVTELASVQQDAVNALNTSLASAGTFSKEASQSFQDLASELQSQSRFGDEVILQQAALARNYARSNEEAQNLIRASLDLSEATGISLDSAVRNLGKTFSGLQGEIGESVPAIRALTAEQLKAGAAVQLIQERFGGSALSAIRTFSGATAQLSNSFGDFLEKIGDSIIRSPVVVDLINDLSKAFVEASVSFKGLSDEDIVGNIIRSTIEVGRFINDFVVRPIEAIGRVATFAFGLFKQAILTVLTPLAALGEGLGRLAEFAGIENSLTTALITVGEVTRKAFVDNASETANAAGDVFSQNFANKIEEGLARAARVASQSSRKLLDAPLPAGGGVGTGDGGVAKAVDKDLESLRDKVFQLQLETEQALKNSFFNNADVIAGTPTIFENVETKGTAALQKLQQSLTQTRDKAQQLSAQVGQAVNNGIANTITNSVSAVVDALRSGEDAFGAFAKAALATIGDLAVQLGQTLIASGIGIEALKVLGGAAAIAAGIALVAVGTLIKGAAGGGAASPTGGSAVTPPLADLEPGGISGTTDPGARVNVTINGSVFDSDETGIRIANILKDEGFQNAVIT